MTSIHFHSPDGTVRVVEGRDGQTVMEVATANGISEIEADCGGACACATCHVVVEEGLADRLPAPSVLEKDMLDFVAEPTPTSRLSCQLRIEPSLDGLILHLPSRQT
ncbi:2Fe-2S iron-sulfur cluster-binding protein [Mesorhizobium kowhaii]|uniref:2Fe-2S iron-sulfur cluster-binding protein n=1 Tax=Mesorhizobium kowhaii TaxID=1300272 RepID=UPI0035ECC898